MRAAMLAGSEASKPAPENAGSLHPTGITRGWSPSAGVGMSCWQFRTSSYVPCRTPNIWLSEQGVVFFKGEKEVGTKEPGTHLWKEPRQAEDVMYAYVKHGLTQLTRQGQLTRFFYYSTRGNPLFDSGLLEAEELTTEAEKNRPKHAAASTPREIYPIYKERTLHGG
jgi:hypothetical protein